MPLAPRLLMIDNACGTATFVILRTPQFEPQAVISHVTNSVASQQASEAASASAGEGNKRCSVAI
jgi:hypothetical protein